MGAGSSVIPGETGAVLLTEGGAFLKFPLPRDLVVLQQACSIVCKHDPEGAALLVNALRKGLGQSHREDVSKGSKGSVSNAVASVPSKVTATGTTSTVGGDNDDTSPSQKNKGTDNDDEGENKANETSASSPAASDKVRQLQESVASLKLLLKERDEKIAHLQARWESESGLKHEFVVENRRVNKELKEAREHLQKLKLSSDEKIQKLHERIRKIQDAAREAQKSASPRSPRASGKPKRKDKGNAGSANKSKPLSPGKASHKHNGSMGNDEIVAAQAKASRRGFALANLQKNTILTQIDEIRRLKELEEREGGEKQDIEVLTELEEEAHREVRAVRVKAAHLQLIYEKLKADTKQVALPSIEAETETYGNVWKACQKEDSEGTIIDNIFMTIDKIKASMAKEDRGRKPRQVVIEGENPTSVEYLTKLRSVAQITQNVLENRLKRYFVGFDVMLPPGIKSVGRSMEKTFEDYEGDVSRLLDTARASVVAEDLHELDSVLTVVLKMIKEGAIIIRRIKNRFKRPTSSGYRDIMFNVCLPHMKEDGASDKYDHHVAELQLHLRGFFAVKNGKGHALYELVRSLGLVGDDPIVVMRKKFLDHGGSLENEQTSKMLIDCLLDIKFGRVEVVGEDITNRLLTRSRVALFHAAMLSQECRVHTVEINFSEWLPNVGDQARDQMFGRPGWKMEPAWERVKTLKSDMNIGEDGVWAPTDREEYLSMFLAFANVLVPKEQATGITLTGICGEEDGISLSHLAEAVLGGTEIKVLSLRDMQIGVDDHETSLNNHRGGKSFAASRRNINTSKGVQTLQWESTRKTLGEASHLGRIISEDHLVTLDLHNSGICTKESKLAPCEEIFRAISRTTKLQHLDLSGNQLWTNGALVHCLSQNNGLHLVSLNVSDSDRVGEEDGAAFFDALLAIPSLLELDISRSPSLLSESPLRKKQTRELKLAAFSSLLNKGKIKTLKMRSLGKDKKAPWRGQKATLHPALDSKGRQRAMVGPAEMEILAEALRNQCSLEKLDIWGYESDELALIEALGVNKRCASINLGSAVADFGDKEALALAEALERSPNSLIECNIFPGHNVGMKGILAISRAFGNCALERFGFGPTFTDIAKLRSSSALTAQILQCGADVAFAMGPFRIALTPFTYTEWRTLSDAQKLEAIVSGETKYPEAMTEADVALDRAFFAQISDIVNRAVNAKSIALWDHPFSSEECSNLCKSVANCKKAHSIKLENIGITDDIASLLGESLSGFTDLKILNVQKNDIGPKGALSIARYIASATNLTEIKMRENPLSSDGLGALALAVAKYSRKRVEVGSDGLDDEAVAAFLKGITNGANIEEVDIFGEVGAKSWKALSDLLSSPTCPIGTIDLVSVKGGASAQTCKDLAAALETNKGTNRVRITTPWPGIAEDHQHAMRSAFSGRSITFETKE